MADTTGMDMKFTVLKNEDIESLPHHLKDRLDDIIHHIGLMREKQGKRTDNTYLVINTDEEYADAIIGHLKRHGHWGAEGNQVMMERMTQEELQAMKARVGKATGDAIVYEFIAHARTDVPRLIAEVERLREALEFIYDRQTDFGSYFAGKMLEGDYSGCETMLNKWRESRREQNTKTD